jgi:N-acetylglucosamine kinase-like BadF-type ATPase
MKKVFLLTALLLALPAVSFAATYQYVDVNGTLQAVSAASSDQAFALASNIAPNSGVILSEGDVNQSSVTTNTSYPPGTYQYIDVNGNVKMVTAANADAALALATGIAPHSGVLNVAATGTAVSAASDTQL